MIVRLGPPCLIGKSAFIVDFLPVFVCYSCANDMVDFLSLAGLQSAGVRITLILTALLFSSLL